MGNINEIDISIETCHIFYENINVNANMKYNENY